jgi:cob(I)alamin adenosyltransferase
MVILNKIYTRTGDDGTTALGTGERRAKHDLRVEAYGTVDETNATVGLARLHTRAEGLTALDAALSRVQNDLFDLGADLCVPETDEDPGFVPLRITAEQVQRLEQEIDVMNAPLTTLRSFVLPAGTPVAAHLHLARTVARRAERLVVLLAQQEGRVGAEAVRYLNRLSDFLFVASRHANANGPGDVLWVPGANR